MACKTHIAHIAHIARSPETVGVQRLGVHFCCNIAATRVNHGAILNQYCGNDSQPWSNIGDDSSHREKWHATCPGRVSANPKPKGFRCGWSRGGDAAFAARPRVEGALHLGKPRCHVAPKLVQRGTSLFRGRFLNGFYST